jgi:hypothetical protein
MGAFPDAGLDEANPGFQYWIEDADEHETGRSLPISTLDDGQLDAACDELLARGHGDVCSPFSPRARNANQSIRKR